MSTIFRADAWRAPMICHAQMQYRKLMRVAVLEENLLWGPRLRQTLLAFGHDPHLVSPKQSAADPLPGVEVAIVNLSSTVFPPTEWVPRLRAAGILVIAHAGHKEKDLLEAARGLECDYVATNSEITNKLPQILEKLTEPSDRAGVEPIG
ncbi:MAG: hypothetical protein SFX74_06630 [Fimbriimonadaceae bacterium]|nr:hypothetical protein [Fimbriimonadaceae bacterium]